MIDQHSEAGSAGGAMTTQDRFQRAADTFSAPLRATGWRKILAALLLVLTGKVICR